MLEEVEIVAKLRLLPFLFEGGLEEVNIQNIKCQRLKLHSAIKMDSEEGVLAYHGTNIDVLSSIIMNGLAKSGTVLETGIYLKPPSHHFQLDRTIYSKANFAAAIFLSPSLLYAAEDLYAKRFLSGANKLILILEVLVRKRNFSCYPTTTPKYKSKSGSAEDINLIEWRVEQPGHIAIQSLLILNEQDLPDKSHCVFAGFQDQLQFSPSYGFGTK